MRYFCLRYFIHGHIHAYSPHVVIGTMCYQTEALDAYGYRLLEL